MTPSKNPDPLNLRIVLPREGVQRNFTLRGLTITVGRHPSNDIQIPVDSVSRFHARFEKQNDSYLVRDLNSSNGTYYDGERVKAVTIEENHQIAFGNVEFWIERGEDRRGSAAGSQPLETPIRFVGDDRKRSRLITETSAGKREATPLEQFIEDTANREELRKAYRQLSTLYKLSDIIRSAPEEQQLLEKFVDLIFEVVPADRGAVLLREGPEGEFRARVSRSRHSDNVEPPISISQTIIDRCVEERVAILSQDAATDHRFQASESIVMKNIRSTMVVPLISKHEILGVLHLDTSEMAKAFNEHDLTFVTSLADDLALYISHNRLAEDARRNQEMAAIGSVITDLAHNIKNILLLSEGGIKLMDRLIDEGDLERIQQTWALTQKSVGRISTMVKQMLDYSRTPKIELRKSNLNKIVRETCESFREEFKKEGIAVKLRLDRRIKDSLIDVEGVERTLTNLLVNACEAISHDDGEITITTMARPRDFILAVEDNGEGIPPSQLSRIFFPRFSTKGDEGTGLGLAEVKRWANALGGSVHVHSVVEEGSRFVLSLPREAQGTVTVSSE